MTTPVLAHYMVSMGTAVSLGIGGSTTTWGSTGVEAPADGEQMYCFLLAETATTATPPSGGASWTLVDDGDIGSGTAHWWLWEKVAASEGTGYTATATPDGEGVIIIASVSGWTTTTAGTVHTETSATTATAPSTMAPANDPLLVGMWGGRAGFFGSYAPPSEFGGNFDAYTADGPFTVTGTIAFESVTGGAATGDKVASGATASDFSAGVQLLFGAATSSGWHMGIGRLT